MRLAKAYQLRDRNRVCRHGITVSECYALEIVVKSGGVLVTELAHALGLNKSTASRVAESLVAQALVRVDAVPGNDRKKRLVSTTRGRALGGRIAGEIRREHLGALAAFNAVELETLARMLDALVESRPGPPASRDQTSAPPRGGSPRRRQRHQPSSRR